MFSMLYVIKFVEMCYRIIKPTVLGLLAASSLHPWKCNFS